MERRLSLFSVLLVLSGCAPSAMDDAVAETGVDGPFDELPDEEQKIDGSAARGPQIAAGAETEVWAVTSQWTDTTTAAARRAGIAWPADSGLDWEQKYERWIASFTLEARRGGSGQTFVMPTPYGERRFHAPTLECAEVALLLRATFASWYHLAFYVTGWDSQARQSLYAGHFGFVNRYGVRIGNFPRFRISYADHEASWRSGQPWPSDSRLRTYRLGTDDAIAFLSDATTERGAGAYFDELFLNKRVGYFVRLLLLYFGSVNLADGSNLFHVRPEAVRAGDVLVHRWQRRGIGHVMPIFRVTRYADDALELAIASGSMPRREPVWEDPSSARWRFLSSYGGGPGTNADGEPYAALGGGVRRWRTAVLRSDGWVNDVIVRDREAFIGQQDTAAIAARPARFDEILRSLSVEERRALVLSRIEEARAHLRLHPASCSARTRREDAFAELSAIGGSDAEYRTLEDYVFGALVYSRSKTCCWNTTTAAMHDIVMDYAEKEERDAAARGECVEPTVFRSETNGYERWRAHAAAIGRAAEWRAWSEDETCTQRAVAEDSVDTSRSITAFCALFPASAGCDAAGGGAQASATAIAPGATRSAQVCAGESDFYRIDATRSVTVRIEFTHSAGDLDMEALAADGSVLSTSDGVTSYESVTATGPFFVRVYGYNGAANRYTVAVQ